MPSLSVSELVSHLEYGTYDYQNYRQHMYSNGQEHHQLMHHQQQEHQQQHHHQQQQQHQWFSYASNQNENNYGTNYPYFNPGANGLPMGVAMLAMAKTT